METTDKNPVVSVIIGSTSDKAAIEPCLKALTEFGIPFEIKVFSAHRTPKELRTYLQSLTERGARLVIAAAGMAAHLPGVIAAEVMLPVIGVPIASGALQGVDALLSISQMPGGVPVACMGIGSSGAKNAAYLAARILAANDAQVAQNLEAVLAKNKQAVLDASI